MVDWYPRRFPDVFAGAENSFVPPEFCFVPAWGRNIVGSRLDDAATWPEVQGLRQ
jgi:hypothetical protein